MNHRLYALALFALTAGASVGTTADAFFSETSTRPPPYGGNGPSLTGFSAVGLASGVTVKAVGLQDGTIVRLK